MVDSLLQRYAAARWALARAQAVRDQRLRARRVDPEHVFIPGVDPRDESQASAVAGHRGPYLAPTVIPADDPDVSAYVRAKQTFDAIEAEWLPVLAERKAAFDAHEAKWAKHFEDEYGLHRAGGIVHFDYQTLEGQRQSEACQADMQQSQNEHAELLASFIMPRIPMSPGWEGEEPEFEITSASDLILYLDTGLQCWRAWTTEPMAAIALDYYGRALRNALRVVDHLRIRGRPNPWPTDPTTLADGERKLSDLIAYLRANALPKLKTVGSFSAEALIAQFGGTSSSKWGAHAESSEHPAKQFFRTAGSPELQQGSFATLEDRPNAKSDSAGIAKRKPKTAGRKTPNLETIKREAELADAWERARMSGGYKPTFAKDNGYTPKAFAQLLDRVAARQRRSDK